MESKKDKKTGSNQSEIIDIGDNCNNHAYLKGYTKEMFEILKKTGVKVSPISLDRERGSGRLLASPQDGLARVVRDLNIAIEEMDHLKSLSFKERFFGNWKILLAIMMIYLAISYILFVFTII
ncbi:MAG: hypothetical protein ACXQS8_07140 [Candidatus Helarchaeales archaeon]